MIIDFEKFYTVFVDYADQEEKVCVYAENEESVYDEVKKFMNDIWDKVYFVEIWKGMTY